MTAPDELALAFACGDDTLVGVLSPPASPATGWGVLIVVGGPQVRAGAHRQYVRLARRLAQAGHAALRFDVRGMGDSTGQPRDFLQLDDDLGAALAALRQACPGVQRVALWGLCDGASAALLYPGPVDARCLVNPWVRTDAGLAQTRLKHHYRNRLRSPAFWRKVLAGGVGWRALVDWWRTWRKARAARAVSTTGTGTANASATAAPFPERMMASLHECNSPVGIVLAAEDETAQEFATLLQTHKWGAAIQAKPWVQCRRVSPADHTFSSAQAHQALEDATLQWLAALPAGATP